MLVSCIVALYFQFIHPLTGFPELSTPVQLVTGVGITSIAWISVTLLTRPSDDETLRSFYRLVKPGGPGWRAVIVQASRDNDPIEEEGEGWDVPAGILCMALGCLAIYSVLFAVGHFIYGKTALAVVLTVIGAVSILLLAKAWKKLKLVH